MRASLKRHGSITAGTAAAGIGMALVAFLFSLTTAVAADPAVPAISVSVVPSAFQIDADGTARTRLIARNASTSEVTGLTLTETTTVGTVCVTRLSPDAATTGSCDSATPTLAASSDATWDVTLSLPKPADGAKATIYLEYDRHDLTAAAHEVVTLEVELVAAPAATASPQPTDPPALASFGLVAPFDALTDRDEGKVYVTVANTSRESITRIDITGHAPPGVTLNPASTSDPNVLPVGQSRTYAIDVSTQLSVQPGKGALVFEVSAQGQTPEASPGASGATAPQPTPRSASAVLSQTVTVAIFGQDTILALIGAPVVPLVPGFVFVAILIVALPFVRTGTAGSLTETDKRLWLLGVPLGLLLTSLYTQLTGRSLIGAYGLYDIMLSWGMAVVAGVILALAWWAAEVGVATARAWWHRRRYVINATDKPLDVVTKLGRAGLSVVLPRTSLVDGKPTETIFVADSAIPATPTLVCVFPGIEAEFPIEPAADPSRRALEGALAPGALAADLPALLKRAIGAGATLKWSQVGPSTVRVPAWLMSDKLVSSPTMDRIVVLTVRE